LKNFGYDKVFVYVGGWEDWKKNGGKWYGRIDR
jgi:hypothetical protein